MKQVDKTLSHPHKLRLRVCLVLVAILIPVLILGLVELGMRLAGYGFDPHFFTRQKVDGVECYVRNPAFSWRFFPKPMARLSTAMVIPTQKPKDVIRVVVLGSSAALGDPEASFGFSRVLDVMLRARYPGKKIEVINTAATAINSNVILPIAEDCAVLEPDLYVVYSGNNEVIGPYGLSSSLMPFLSNRSIIRAQVFLGSTRLGQWLKSSGKQSETFGDEWRGMELFLKQKVRLNDPKLQKVYEHFENNLDDICRVAERAGAKVLLCSVIVNDKDCAPFVSLHKVNLDDAKSEQWNGLFEKGKIEEAAGQWKTACDLYAQAAAIDDEYAELHYRMGHCYWNQDNQAAAAVSYKKARELDALRFRADDGLNAAIQRVAKKRGVAYVDAAAVARQASVGGVPGKELLYEHVHLNFAGNYLLAGAVLGPIEKTLRLESQITVPTVEECRKRLALTVFDEKRVEDRVSSRLQAAPFINQCDHAQALKRVKDRVAALVAASKGQAELSDRIYREALADRPDDWQLRLNYLYYLYELGLYPQANEQAMLIYKKLPMEHFAMMNMGITLQKLKRYDEADDFLNRTIQANPFLREGYEKLGLLREEQKRFNEAEALFQKRHSSVVLAGFYSRVGDYYAREHALDQARQYYNRALEVVPGFPDAATNLDRLNHPVQTKAPEEMESYRKAMAWMRQGQFDEAVLAWKEVVSAAPQSARVRNNYGFALVKVKQYEAAIPQFSEAVRLCPKATDGLQNLASVYGLLGRHAEAIETIQKAIEIKPARAFYLLLADEYEKSGQDEQAKSARAQARQLATP